MELLDTYLKTRQQILDYFGYVEDWGVFPIEDGREYYWYLESTGLGTVHFASSEQDLREQTGAYYVHELCYPLQSVFRRPDFTMILVDTHTDGNLYLVIFDNANERLGLIQIGEQK